MHESWCILRLRLKRCEARTRHSVFLAYLGPIVEVSLISSEAFAEKLVNVLLGSLTAGIFLPLRSKPFFLMRRSCRRTSHERKIKPFHIGQAILLARLVSKSEQHPVVSNRVNPFRRGCQGSTISNGCQRDHSQPLLWGPNPVVMFRVYCGFRQRRKLGQSQDRGNNRVRVIFGSLGPQPQTQDRATRKFGFLRVWGGYS